MSISIEVDLGRFKNFANERKDCQITNEKQAKKNSPLQIFKKIFILYSTDEYIQMTDKLHKPWGKSININAAYKTILPFQNCPEGLIIVIMAIVSFGTLYIELEPFLMTLQKLSP